jgi:hypothetical protein
MIVDLKTDDYYKSIKTVIHISYIILFYIHLYTVFFILTDSNSNTINPRKTFNNL